MSDTKAFSWDDTLNLIKENFENIQIAVCQFLGELSHWYVFFTLPYM